MALRLAMHGSMGHGPCPAFGGSVGQASTGVKRYVCINMASTPFLSGTHMHLMLTRGNLGVIGLIKQDVLPDRHLHLLKIATTNVDL